MALIWQWMIMVLATLATSNNGESVESCAMPLMVTRGITFRTSIGGNDVYNNTEYRFDGLVCNHVSYDDIGGVRYEKLKCKTGNITHSSSQVTGKKQIDIDINHINGLICKTKEQPNLMPNLHVHFSCEIGEHYGFYCDASKFCVIEPASLYQRSGQNLEEWKQLIGYRGTNFISLEGGYGFECPEPFVCYWQTCSSILITSKEWDANTDPQRLEISLRLSLEGILKMPSHFTSLEITKTNVSQLPVIICQFRNLRRLVLVHNNLSELPDCLEKLSNLEILDVSFNALKSIKRIYFGSGGNNKKKFLDLSFNQITYIDIEALEKFDEKGLEFLSLRNNALKNIDLYLPNLLNHIDLSNNNIKYIKLNAWHEPQVLKTLLLQHNEIETVDFYIPSPLISLDLSHNYIESVNGEKLRNAKNLEGLFLNNNRIRQIRYPYSMPYGLKYITLNNNHFEKLDFLSKLSLKSLEIMDLSYNSITSVDFASFKNAKNLKTLLLQHNIIREIDGNILKEKTILPKMKNMNFSHNQLRVAPLNLIFLKRLQTVDFSHNKIETCTWLSEDEEEVLMNIDYKLNGFCMSNYNQEEDKNIINLEHNRIKSLKDVFGLESIMLHKHAILFCHLKLRHNPFHCNCHMFSYLNKLLTYNWNNEIMTTTCESPTQLKSRSVFDKEIVDTLTCNLLPEQKCKFIYKPSEKTLTVNCSDLNLTKFPLTDETLRHALEKSAAENFIPDGINTEIDLNGNNFSKIISGQEKTLLPVLMEIGINTRINVLDLSHSNINEINDMFLFDLSYQIPNLTKLHLNDNNLTALPNHILHFESLSLNKDHIVPYWNKVNELHLYNNPWDCSCSAQWMKRWLNNMIERDILVRPNEIQCYTPKWNRGKMVHMIGISDFCIEPSPIHTSTPVVVSVLVATMVIIIVLKLGNLQKLMKWIGNGVRARNQSSSAPGENLTDKSDAITAPLIGETTEDDNDIIPEPSTVGNVQVVDSDEIKPLALSEESQVMKADNDGEARELQTGNDKVRPLFRDDRVFGDNLTLTSPTRASEDEDDDRDNGNDDDDDITVLSASTDSALDEATAISFGRRIADDNETIPETLSRASKVDNDDIAEMKLDVFASFSKKDATSNTK
ncbi:slit homolog 2 protein-like [Lineus longissimus]|uniref:slit homolog 2 protein-like n=1 Tax=Lineus longissimus TaxID=88925 RepID=UPI00315CB6EE